MPLYEYHCLICGTTRDIEYGIEEEHMIPICCHTSMSRVWSAVSAIFKGSGWYKNDNRK